MTLDLAWQAPALDNPTIVDLDKTPEWQTYFEFGQDEDVVFLGGSEVHDQLNVAGGHNIVILGGEFRPTWASSAAIQLRDFTGAAHVEGVHIDTAMAGAMDGIVVAGAEGSAPDATVQNVLVEHITGVQDGAHGDVLQTQGPLDQLRIYNMTGDSNYQGLFIAPQSPTGSAILGNINLEYGQGGQEISYLYWFLDDDSETPFPVSLSNIYTDHRPGQAAQDFAVWPVAEAMVRDGVRELSWDDRPYAGVIVDGKPAAGDFVTADQVGSHYVSSGVLVGLDGLPLDLSI